MGNKTETSVNIGHFILLEIPMVLGFVYYLRLQVYVFVYDIVLNCMGLGFLAIELILAILEYSKVKYNESMIIQA